MDGNTQGDLYAGLRTRQRVRLMFLESTGCSARASPVLSDIPGRHSHTIAEFLQVMEKKAHQEADGEQREEDLPVVQAPLSEEPGSTLMPRHVRLYLWSRGSDGERYDLERCKFRYSLWAVYRAYYRSYRFRKIYADPAKNTERALLPPSEVLFHGTDIQSGGF